MSSIDNGASLTLLMSEKEDQAKESQATNSIDLIQQPEKLKKNFSPL